MSRQARTRSSFLLLGVLVVALFWAASRGIARAGESRADAVALASSGARVPSTSAAKAVVHPIPHDFKVGLLRAGLDARALAAAGVSSQSVLAALQAAADVMNASPGALDTLDDAYGTARAAADARERKIQSGLASQEEVSGYAALKSARDSAAAACQTALDSIFSAAAATLTEGQRSALTTIRTNRAWGFDPEYLTVSRSEADWVHLRDALANERIAVQLPGTLDHNAQTLLSSVRADGTVAAALASVSGHLPDVASAWNTAAGD